MIGFAEWMRTAAGPKYPNPADHPVFQEYAPHPSHIVAAYDGASPSERHQGGRWFEDQHHIAAAVGAHSGVGKHVMAGLMAAYSPQMEHHPAMHNAVRTAYDGEPVRQGQGPYVTSNHAKSANKILAGEHHQSALGGAKSQDMAHLIEHGGRDPETGGWSHRAPMGHNEFAVASGLGYSDEETEKSARKVLGNRHYYDHLSGMFHAAAQMINERDGTSLAAHHVAAVTNLASKRQADEDAGMHEPSAQSVRDRTQTKNYLTKTTPGLDPANTHLAYGEVKAPQQVDTLRDEACPVCGETDSYDGDECMVCGFVAPPDKFQDPDVDMAKQVDLRAREDGTIGGQDAAGLSADINDRDRDGLDDATGEPIDPDGAEQGALDAQPMLTCPVCGFQIEGAEPTSTSTTDPQLGDDGADPMAAGAEGDLCPNCGRGVLESANQLAQEGDPEADPDGDPMADPDAPPVDPDADPDDDGFPEQDPKGSPGKFGDDEDEDPDADPDADPDDEPESDDNDVPPVKKKKSPFK